MSEESSCIDECDICADDIAKDCEDLVYLGGWCDVTPSCGTCGAHCCSGCLVTCFSCQNERRGEKNAFLKVFCVQCSPAILEDVGCEHHRWFCCPDHKDRTCGTCRANKNYAGKHEL